MRSLKSVWSVALIAALALTAAACSDDDNKPKDSGVDKSKLDGNVPPPVTLTCKGDCKDFVFDTLTFPDANTAAQIGVDYNNDGAVDNALGSILGALSGITSSLDLQKSIDNALHRGKTTMLTRMQASSWTSEPKAAAQAWVGKDIACCTSTTDDAKCKTEAMAGCFGGSYTFYPDMTKSDAKAIFGGTITAGAFKFGSTASSMSLSLPITDAGTLKLNLKGVFLMGNVDSTGTRLTNGILAGVVTKADLDNSLIPEITKMLNTTLTDPTVDQSTKDTIKTLFDTNPADGKIDVKEVADNALIKTFLAGDVDVDGDGNMELSLGISFTGTSATINDKGTAPDAGTPDTSIADTSVADAGVDAATAD